MYAMHLTQTTDSHDRTEKCFLVRHVHFSKRPPGEISCESEAIKRQQKNRDFRMNVYTAYISYT